MNQSHHGRIKHIKHMFENYHACFIVMLGEIIFGNLQRNSGELTLLGFFSVTATTNALQ